MSFLKLAVPTAMPFDVYMSFKSTHGMPVWHMDTDGTWTAGHTGHWCQWWITFCGELWEGHWDRALLGMDQLSVLDSHFSVEWMKWTERQQISLSTHASLLPRHWQSRSAIADISNRDKWTPNYCLLSITCTWVHNSRSLSTNWNDRKLKAEQIPMPDPGIQWD